MEKEKTFTFGLTRAGGGPRSYTRKESELKPSEINLLLGDLLKHYSDSPRIVQLLLVQRIVDEINKQNAESNKTQSGETGMEPDRLSESGTPSESTNVREEQVQPE